MKKHISLILFLLAATMAAFAQALPKGGHYAVVAEQAKHHLAIIDADSGNTVWIWDKTKSGLPKEHFNWFNCPTEVKPVYNGECILIVSNGGIGLVRISDHKMVWYAESGGGFPHSAEVLPDGNVAVACSISNTPAGNKLKIFEVDYDNIPTRMPVAEYPLRSGHNAVWDRKNKVLWSSTENSLNSYRYFRDEAGKPAFQLCDSLALPAGAEDPHDLFPVYGENKLWMTTKNDIFKFDPKSKTFQKMDFADSLNRIKSISNGPKGYKTLLLMPTKEWWTYYLRDPENNTVVTCPEYFKMYKARWMVDNTFSYPKKHRLTITK